MKYLSACPSGHVPDMHSVTLEYVLQILADTGQPLYVCLRHVTGN